MKFTLLPVETSVLTFCLTPRFINWSDISADSYDFARRMRLTESWFFLTIITLNQFGNKTTWNSPPNREEASHQHIFRGLQTWHNNVQTQPRLFETVNQCRTTGLRLSIRCWANFEHLFGFRATFNPSTNFLLFWTGFLLFETFDAELQSAY